MSGVLNILLGLRRLVTPSALFNLVTSLLSANGNATNNNTVTDRSVVANSLTLTRNGTPTQGTFTPFSQTGWSNYFDGSGDYLTIPDNAIFEMPGDYTVEAFFYCLELPGAGLAGNILTKGASGVFQPYYIFIRDSGLLVFYSSSTGSSWDIASNVSFGTPALNTWNHVAVSRSGANVRMFLNGALVQTINNATSGNPLTDNTRAVGIAGRSDGTETAFKGFISNVRIVKGRAVYTSAFTVPTAPLGVTSGGQNPPQGTETSLLTCQNYRFMDSSTFASTVTRNGDARIESFSPFSPTVSWSNSTVGGGLYFDGNGDYLTNVNTQASQPDQYQLIRGLGDWTFECFVYPFAYGGTTAGADLFAVTNVGSTGGSSNGYHINLGEDINNFRLISNASGTWQTDLSAGAGNGPPLYAWSHMAVVRQASRISIFRNGTRVATNTTFGTYQYSTSPTNSPGNYSLVLQGGNAITCTGVSANFGTGNFTAEFFCFRPYVDFCSGLMLSTGTNSNSFELRVGDNNCLIFHTGGSNLFTEPTVPQNQWVHCAVARSGTHLAAWINGTRVYSNTSYSKNFTGDGNIYVLGGRTGSDGTIYLANVRLSTTVYYSPTSTTITPPFTGFSAAAGDRLVAGVSNVTLANSAGSTMTVLAGSPTVYSFGPATRSQNNQAPNQVIGRFSDGTNTRDFHGYIANPLFSTLAKYDPALTTLTVPTVPNSYNFTSDTLFNVIARPESASSVGIIDATSKNDWVTVGTVQTSTTATQWGGSSISFPGANGSYLQAPSGSTIIPRSSFDFGTGNFTIEGWYRFTVLTGVNRTLFNYGYEGASDRVLQWYVTAAGVVRLSYSLDGINDNPVIFGTPSPAIALDTFYHLALVRNGATITCYVNGTALGTTGNIGTSALFSGLNGLITVGSSVNSAAFSGFLQDFRVTKAAVYTANFPVPTAAFPTL